MMDNKTTQLLDVKTDNITDYRKTSLLLVFPNCSGKCKDCQNRHLFNTKSKEYKNKDIVKLYKSMPTHEAIVFAGLEPFDSFAELQELVKDFMIETTGTDIVIYTGYTREELKIATKDLLEYTFNVETGQGVANNIIIKYGRYDNNYDEPWYSEALGVTLATHNQEVVVYPKYGKIIHETAKRTLQI